MTNNIIKCNNALAKHNDDDTINKIDKNTLFINDKFLLSDIFLYKYNNNNPKIVEIISFTITVINISITIPLSTSLHLL